MPSALQKEQFFKRLLLILIAVAFMSFSPVFAQTVEADSIPVKSGKLKTNGLDSLKINADSTATINGDSLTAGLQQAIPDSLAKRKKNKMLDSKVKYTARDSMRLDAKNKKMHLYGEAQVDYESIKLTGGYIMIDFNTKTAYAKGVIDSLGNKIEKPEFEENGQSFSMEEMSFNFETKKGLIKDVITKEGEGYIHGEKVKKMENDVMYIKSGKYTTCDNPEPHFHIHATKLKIIPNDKIITGPALLKIENIPTPLGLPFGFFPNKTGQSSGIIMPQYGESQQVGFFLTNGGYYFALSDKMDLSVMGDIYSKGSWAIGGITNYRSRYKFNGSLDARFSNIKIGESGLRDFRNAEGVNPFFQENRDFMIRWGHRQDPKARPNSLFSADVNAGTSNYNRLNSFSGANAANALTSQLQSNISYSRSWAGKPYNLSLNARHSQNTITGDVSIILPEATFTVNRFFPFKRAVQIGEQKWFEKIGVTYSNAIKNELITKDTLLWDADNFSRMRNGMMQQANASTSFRILKHFTLTPGINTTNRTYIQSLHKSWDNENDT
ncbi:MAG: LPS-assembly protein LptD, partial [Bacteroidetes bacterium]|nr:LPS-assembly protein LptD [Bacteroidota bacterium]